MKHLNDYGSLLLTNTMSDLVQLFNNNTDNSALVDALLAFTIDTGVFRSGEEKVNNLPIGPHTSVAIPTGQLSSIQFTGFYMYFKSLHKIFTEIPNIDLSSYNTGKLYLLYLKSDLTPVILEERYEGEEDYLLLARFVIKDSVLQFYVCTRNAGTNPFDRNGVTYEVIEGFDFHAIEANQLQHDGGVIKYSGINILSAVDTDILVEPGSVQPQYRYITSNNKVDWTLPSQTTLELNKIIDYTTQTITTVTDTTKFICQKAYYDYMTQTLVMQYGSVVYDSMNEALAGASNFNYDTPDWKNAYIPLAVFIHKVNTTDFTDNTQFRTINVTDNSSLSAATAVDPTAQALANSALAAAQVAQTTADSGVTKADKAQADATKGIEDALNAQTTADDANEKIETHLSDDNNPHSVTKAQIGLSSVDNTSDVSKPISTPTKQYVDGQVTELTKVIDTKASNETQTKNVVKATQPTNSDFGRAPIKGDLWLIP